MKTKSIFNRILGLMLTLLALITGASGNVLMAAASDLPDAGVSASGDAGDGNGGVASVTQGQEDGDPDFYAKQIDSKPSYGNAYRPDFQICQGETVKIS